VKRCEAKVEQERMQEDFERRMMEKRTGKPETTRQKLLKAIAELKKELEEDK